jgi:hypothetical protein
MVMVNVSHVRAAFQTERPLAQALLSRPGLPSGGFRTLNVELAVAGANQLTL